MVTKEQAMTCGSFHENGCSKEIGPRGGVKITIKHIRANGACKTWKRSPERFRLPVKFGLYAYGAITDANADYFHIPSECLIEEGRFY